MRILNVHAPQGDVLDILFADRNKSYGAYYLRRNYPSRLKTAVGVVMGTLVVGGLLLSFKKGPVLKVGSPVYEMETLFVQPPPPDKKPVKPITAHARHAVVVPLQVPAAVMPPPTIGVTPPVIVDHVNTPLPANAALDGKQIGPASVDGDASRSGYVGGLAGGTGKDADAGGVEQGEEGGVYKSVEQMPTFPGGEEALRRFLMRYLRAPEDMEAGDKVVVLVRFVVGGDGQITACAVEKSGGRSFDEAVMRVVKKMPKWNPGQQNGHPVSVYFTLPVTFTVGG